MKKRKYLYRLSIVMLLGLIVPAFLFFLVFWRSAFGQMEQTNEDFYEKALVTYMSLLDNKIHDLERFAAEISAESREHDSALGVGAMELERNTYQLYSAVKELKERYSRRDVSEWGIYFYDIDKLITPEHTYALEHFIYKYTGQAVKQAGCSDFFSQENYSQLRIIFDTTNKGEKEDGYLLAGVCTRIGSGNDRALVFYVLSPKDINDSLAIVGGEGITYYLQDMEDRRVLLVWGDEPAGKEKDILESKEWEHTAGGRQKVLYNIGSNYEQLTVTAHISRDSMQNNLMEWAVNIKRLLVGTVLVLLLVCIFALYISYKPVHELISEFEDSEDGEFERIRNMLAGKDLRIGEQEMLILDLLVNHLIYGIPISEERIKRLGIGESVHCYCVFLAEGYFFRNSEVEALTGKAWENSHARIFITDWQAANYSVVIAFLEKEDSSDLQEELEGWLKKSYAEEYTLYTGKTVDKLENIQMSFRSCLSQMKKKNDKKLKSDTDMPTPKEEQQKKMKEEILAYLEVHFRDPDLSQVQVADLFRISNYTLSRLFKNRVGVGFAEYLTAKRLEYAKELLLTTTYSVKEVAAMVGFASENYFSRTFKLYEGISPSSFRKK